MCENQPKQLECRWGLQQLNKVARVGSPETYVLLVSRQLARFCARHDFISIEWTFLKVQLDSCCLPLKYIGGPLWQLQGFLVMLIIFVACVSHRQSALFVVFLFWTCIATSGTMIANIQEGGFHIISYPVEDKTCKS